MNYWKYQFKLAGQIVLASLLYGLAVFAITHWKPAKQWQGNVDQVAWQLGTWSAALCALLGLGALAVAVCHDCWSKKAAKK